MMAFPFKILITGLSGFSGQHLETYLYEKGYRVIGLKSDLTDRKSLFYEISQIAPSHVIHLAGISFAAELDSSLIYKVNVTGTVNLLDALCDLKKPIEKVVLASSATIYGNLPNSILTESLCPKPINHYGCSKLAMEYMAQNYMDKLPLLITRPFNYTGIGHAEHFLIPKIIKAYRQNQPVIELGNLDVFREFNDVRDICKIYFDLILSDSSSKTVNLCSGRVISLMDIIHNMNRIAGYEMDVRINPDFVRINEIKTLCGDVEALNRLVPTEFKYSIKDTLQWMYEEKI